MAVLVETSPLISFLKVSRFDLLEQFGEPVCCTAEVIGEVLYFPQRAPLEGLLAAGKVHTVDLDHPDDLLDYVTLTTPPNPYGPGEVSSILYAARNGVDLIITDKKAIREAKKRKVTIMSTQDVILRAIDSRILSVQDADDLISFWITLNEFPVEVKSFSELR